MAEEYLTNSVSENVTRTEQEKNKYDINIHDMSWAEIAAVQDKTVFLDCMLCGDTKKVELSLNDKIGTGTTYSQYGDGTGMLYWTINDYYKIWNPAYNNSNSASNNSAVGTGLTLASDELFLGSNARDAGGYSVSHIRATLIGENSKTNTSYAGDVNLNETTSLYSCLPRDLKNVITAKKVRYVTGSDYTSGNYNQNTDIIDKIWAFSNREISGTGEYSGITIEGIGNDGLGYSRFTSSESRYYTSSYNDSNCQSRVCYNESSVNSNWWLRSLCLSGGYSNTSCAVTGGGGLQYSYKPCNQNGLTFGFCIK